MSGGAFLLGPTAPACALAPEDLPANARLLADTMTRFVRAEVLPHANALEAREDGLLRRLMGRAGELGLLAGGVPTEFGGLALSRAALCLLYEKAALCPSFALAHNVHSGVATLPIAWFGTEGQKARYLPRLARGEWVGAFALSEANSGSDALAARCRAERMADGYRLTGVKNWITNAGLADLFVVFARVEGEGGGLTAFLVERSAPGVSLGREEEKLGLRGASTCALVLDGVEVGEAAVLGAVGGGHRVALHPLNVGRLNIGAGALGAAKESLRAAAAHAATRRQFGRPLAEFGLIQEKLGATAARLFAAESMVYRVAGLLDASMARDAELPPRAAEEYAVECALVKVYATEALAYAVDESLQIHGGYGYSEAYPAARAYRDARVSRIFEGTNEINRLTVVDQLARRVKGGRLALVAPSPRRPLRGYPAPPRTGEGEQEGEVGTSSSPLPSRSDNEGEGPGERADAVKALRDVTRAALLALWKLHPGPAATAQECAAACADLCLALFAAESAALRAAKMPPGTARRGRAEDAAAVVLGDACDAARRSVWTVCTHLDDRALWGRLSALLPEPWIDAVSARRRLAAACGEAEGYPF